MTPGAAVPCTVKSFKPMQGFGTLVLEGGEELSFDISACDTRNVQEGARGKVLIGPGLTGKPKALRVLLAPPAPETLRVPMSQAVAQLHAWGLLTEWTPETCQERLRALPLRTVYEVTGGRPRPADASVEDMDRDDAAGLIAGYYGEGLTAQARADRTFLVPAVDSHARYARALVEGLCAIIGDPDFCSLKLKNAHTGVLTARSGQQHKVSVGHGDTVVHVINGILAAQAAPARVLTRKLFGTPWFVFREESHKPDGIAAALLIP
jgi:cold shock CspA family protein